MVFGQNYFTGRYGQPEEVAGLAEFLALNPSASYITGQVTFSNSHLFLLYEHYASVFVPCLLLY